MISTIGSLGSECRHNNHPNSSFSIQNKSLDKKARVLYGLMNSYSRYRTSSSHFPLELCDDEAVATVMFLTTRSRGLLRCSVPLILMKQSGMESVCVRPTLTLSNVEPFITQQLARGKQTFDSDRRQLLSQSKEGIISSLLCAIMYRNMSFS